MPRKAEKSEKPKKVYRKKTDAKPSVKPEPKTPYNWRQHVKPKAPENTPEYLRAENAVEKDLMIQELDKWINMFPNALNALKNEAGEILVEDVMYHLNMVSRILKNKFQEKEVRM